MSEHTKGPWKAVNNGDTVDNWDIYWSDDGECVVDHVYTEADARLIAAAPDLLEALQEAHAAFLTDSPNPDLRNCIEKALAKAHPSPPEAIKE